MKRNYTVYHNDFKKEALDMLKDGCTIREVAYVINVPPSTIWGWKKNESEM